MCLINGDEQYKETRIPTWEFMNKVSFVRLKNGKFNIVENVIIWYFDNTCIFQICPNCDDFSKNIYLKDIIQPIKQRMERVISNVVDSIMFWMYSQVPSLDIFKHFLNQEHFLTEQMHFYQYSYNHETSQFNVSFICCLFYVCIRAAVSLQCFHIQEWINICHKCSKSATIVVSW